MGIDLYSLLPFVVRLKDSATGQSQGVIQRIMLAIQTEVDATQEQIANLVTLIDPSECDPQYLFYISSSLGFAVSDTLPSANIKFSRWYVENLIPFFKIHGTVHSWTTQWVYVNPASDTAPGTSVTPHQLLKEHIHEKGDYFRSISDSYGLMNSARFDIDNLGNQLSVTDARQYLNSIEWCRPIHVLLRLYYHEFDFSDAVSVILDETVAVSNGLLIKEILDTGSDSFSLDVTCMVTCETACESGQETACSTFCEISCEVAVEYQGPPGPAGPPGPPGADAYGTEGPAGPPGTKGSDGTCAGTPCVTEGDIPCLPEYTPWRDVVITATPSILLQRESVKLQISFMLCAAITSRPTCAVMYLLNLLWRTWNNCFSVTCLVLF